MNPDTIQCYQTYVAFNGDLQRTAVALNMTLAQVQEMAKEENWVEHSKDWLALREGNSQDVSIQVNRAVNFVQSHRIRNLLDTVVTELSKLSPEDLLDRLSTKRMDKDGNVHITGFSTRPLTDLVKGAEAAQLMTQRALGDTAGERPEDAKGVKGSSIALLVQQAMTAADKTGIGSADVVREQLRLNDTGKASDGAS